MLNALPRLALPLALAAALPLLQACTSSDDDADACGGADTTSLFVRWTAPAGVAGEVVLTGPGGRLVATGDSAFRGIRAGDYTLAYKRVKTSGPLIGKAYYARFEPGQISLRPCAAETLKVAYAQEPGSEHLFVASRGGSAIHAYSASKLAATGNPAPDAVLQLKGGPTSPRALAFDPHGNLWFAHSAGISMFAMGDLSDSNAEVARTLDGSALLGGFASGAAGLAFAPDSSLWVALPGSDKVVRLAPDQLQASGKPTPAIALSGPDLDEPNVLAFDAEGNLWVGGVKTAHGADGIVRFDKARLTASYAGPADARFAHRTPAQKYTGISALAFDKDGNLDIAYDDQGVLVRLPKALQGASADSLAPAGLLDGVAAGASLQGLALDEAGGAWTTAEAAGAAGAVLRVAPGLLGTAGTLVGERVITGASLGVANGIALNPAPEALPLAD